MGQQCMCGGWIRPISSALQDIELAVSWHNRTPRHRAYVTGIPLTEAPDMKPAYVYVDGKRLRRIISPDIAV